jgi:hypothetical protein
VACLQPDRATGSAAAAPCARSEARAPRERALVDAKHTVSTVRAAGVIPDELLFKDYDNPILSAWNWSFLPLDLAISATGLTALRRAKRGLGWRNLALVSFVLTSCSGLMAVSFWTLRADFDPAWWLPNLFLLLYPLWFLPGLVRGAQP